MTNRLTANNIQANTIVAANFASANVGVLIAGDNITIEANGRISVTVQ